jgi:DNA-binding MarR family transcriptional regulator
MRITKQALGKLARQLADRGYVRIEPDPDDRRAKVVRSTRTARPAAPPCAPRWPPSGPVAAEVGPERFAVFREVLDELTQHLVDAGRAGHARRRTTYGQRGPRADLTGEWRA